MPPWQQIVLEMHLPAIRAMKVLHNPELSGSLNALALYDLVLEATDDEEYASAAASARGMERLRQNLPV